MNVRASAVSILEQVLVEKKSLTAAIVGYKKIARETPDFGLLQELCYGVLRWRYRLEAYLAALTDKPFRKKDQDVFLLLLIGIYQLAYLRIPPHAAVKVTVEAARHMGKSWATGLVNAVMRNFLREQNSLYQQLSSEAALLSHPDWLLALLKRDWPEHWREIANANNERPPFILRTNARALTREQYLAMLNSMAIEAQPTPFAERGVVVNKPMDVKQVPGFSDGIVSVQDGAAQLVAPLLNLASGQRVLDACAAPGGKTCHILETQAELKELIALDGDEERVKLIEENLKRLQLTATVIAADSTKPELWFKGKPFDRILVDAPCTGTGVIRRHPDIKSLRQPEDVQQLALTQKQLLHALWPLLKRGGMLVYTTCSVLAKENSEQVAHFMSKHNDAHEIKINVDWGHPLPVGRQILPGENGMDGFYFARIGKQ